MIPDSLGRFVKKSRQQTRGAPKRQGLRRVGLHLNAVVLLCKPRGKLQAIHAAVVGNLGDDSCSVLLRKPADSAGRDGADVVIVGRALEVVPRVDQYAAVRASRSSEHLPRGSRIGHRPPGQVLQRGQQSVLGGEAGDVGEAGGRIVEVPGQVGGVDRKVASAQRVGDLQAFPGLAARTIAFRARCGCSRWWITPIENAMSNSSW